MEISKEKLQNLANTSCSIKEILEKLGFSSRGNNYNTISKLIKELDIDTTILDKNRRKLFSTNKKNKGDILKILSGEIKTMMKPSRLLNLIVEFDIKKYQCERCGISEWNGIPIRLELHHKDGNHENSKLENIEILCPNCHSQTDNFRYKGRSTKKKRVCVDCGKEVSKRAKRCRSCAVINGKKTGNTGRKSTCQISKDDLINELFQNDGNFTTVGKKFCVADNTIRRWCKKFGISKRSEDYKTHCG